MWRLVDGASLSSAESSWWQVRSVRVGGRDESEDSIARGKWLYLIQSNKHYPIGENRLTRLDRTLGTDNIQRQTRTGLQTQGDYKGSK